MKLFWFHFLSLEAGRFVFRLKVWYNKPRKEEQTHLPSKEYQKESRLTIENSCGRRL
ncbi:hypothetical protein BAXH7_01106 [Bacillus amyloliquefaciens XH7]|nr:hypothetical protein BAMTA208_05285 [Bacillus amyloliquefaciens TA208]AEK88248.1 hypothetical protein BAXH7_01106 [Bacillus amyloliquefaciens XH7]QBG56822.1 hypothetical protein D2M30_2493 [Bacillus amyloliquefaciens]